MLKFTNEQRERYRKSELAQDAKNQYIQSSKFRALKANEEYDKEATDNLANVLYNTFEKINQISDREDDISRIKKAFNDSNKTIPIDSALREESERALMNAEDVRQKNIDNLDKARAARLARQRKMKAKLRERKREKSDTSSMMNEDLASRRFNDANRESSENNAMKAEEKRQRAIANLNKAREVRAANKIKNTFQTYRVKKTMARIPELEEKPIHKERKNSLGPMSLGELTTPKRTYNWEKMPLEQIREDVKMNNPDFYHSEEYDELMKSVQGNKRVTKRRFTESFNRYRLRMSAASSEKVIQQPKKMKPRALQTNKYFTES